MHTHPEEPMLPDPFAALEPFAKKWCLEREVDRYQERLDSTMIELQALYEAGMRYGEAAQAHLDQFDLYNNSVFYDPTITYKPWVKYDGTPYAAASTTAALYNPVSPTLGSLNLTTQQTVDTSTYTT